VKSCNCVCAERAFSSPSKYSNVHTQRFRFCNFWSGLMRFTYRWVFEDSRFWNALVDVSVASLTYVPTVVLKYWSWWVFKKFQGFIRITFVIKCNSSNHANLCLSFMIATCENLAHKLSFWDTLYEPVLYGMVQGGHLKAGLRYMASLSLIFHQVIYTRGDG